MGWLGDVVGFGGSTVLVVVVVAADPAFLVSLEQVETLERAIACRAVQAGCED